jgi:hypothetical protein
MAKVRTPSDHCRNATVMAHPSACHQRRAKPWKVRVPDLLDQSPRVAHPPGSDPALQAPTSQRHGPQREVDPQRHATQRRLNGDAAALKLSLDAMSHSRHHVRRHRVPPKRQHRASHRRNPTGAHGGCACLPPHPRQISDLLRRILRANQSAALPLSRNSAALRCPNHAEAPLGVVLHSVVVPIAWPLFDLRVTTPRLTLRLPVDAELARSRSTRAPSVPRRDRGTLGMSATEP